MKILIAPMAAMAETSGPITRARALAIKAKERGHEVAFCAAEDVIIARWKALKITMLLFLRLLDCLCLSERECLRSLRCSVSSKEKRSEVSRKFCTLWEQSTRNSSRKTYIT